MSEQPLLRVVRGTPDDAELAALTAVVAALSVAAAESADDTGSAYRSGWADPGPRMRNQLRPGPGAWRASAMPR